MSRWWAAWAGLTLGCGSAAATAKPLAGAPVVNEPTGAAVASPPGTPPAEAAAAADQVPPPEDPFAQAVAGLLDGRWGLRSDKDQQVRLPLPDAKQWKRIRYWGVDHLTGFRYGKKYEATVIAVPLDLNEGVEATSRRCARRFEAWSRPQLKNYGVEIGEIETKKSEWRGKELVVAWVDGHVDFGFERKRFAGAWAAYPAYGNACLIYGVAVQWKTQPDTAHALRDRWVNEAFGRTQALTTTKPFRH
jgi:hypothetical protein